MAKRPVHFGIDYGTSNSKLVVRDFEAPGGERAHVILDADSARFSSSLAITSDLILFGRRPKDRHRALRAAEWFESVKMRVADEIKASASRYTFGSPPPLPAGLSAKALATLTVWWLIAQALQGAKATVKLQAGQTLEPGMTIGIPMSFLTDADLRAAFVDISRAAWSLFRHGPGIADHEIQRDVARRNVQEALAEVERDPVPPDEVRFWVRSEAEAALWWAFRSPQVPEGPYAKVDIGAGTTNASIFRIVAGIPEGTRATHPVKLKMAFFGAASRAQGMDAIDEALARHSGASIPTMTTIRGNENRLLAVQGAKAICAPVLIGMYSALQDAWAQNKRLKPTKPEVQAWLNSSRLFVLGGGGLVDTVRDAMLERPSGGLFPLMKLESPPDLVLSGRKVTRDALPFVLVAYGLSVLAPPIPLIETPDEIPPMPTITSRLLKLDHEDIYAK